MAEYFLKHSPLAPLGLGARVNNTTDGATVYMGERPFRQQVGLRGDISDAAFRSAIKKAVGIEPPAAAHETTGPADLSKGVRILWMSPDEWICVTHAESEKDMLGDLTAALAGQHAAVWDIAGSRTVIAVSGPDARNLLAKGCSLDLHLSVFPVGHIIAGHLALGHVEIDYVANDADGNPVLELYVHRSFAEYIWTWLEDAAQEYGVQVLAED